MTKHYDFLKHAFLALLLILCAGCEVCPVTGGRFASECRKPDCQNSCGTVRGPRHQECERLPICDAPFFGHQPTCWHQWPTDWAGCPPCYAPLNQSAPVGEGQEPEYDEIVPPPVSLPLGQMQRSKHVATTTALTVGEEIREDATELDHGDESSSEFATEVAYEDQPDPQDSLSQDAPALPPGATEPAVETNECEQEQGDSDEEQESNSDPSVTATQDTVKSDDDCSAELTATTPAQSDISATLAVVSDTLVAANRKYVLVKWPDGHWTVIEKRIKASVAVAD